MQVKNEPTRELSFELPYLFRTPLPLCLIRSALHWLHPFICPPTRVGLLLIDLKLMRRSIPLRDQSPGPDGLNRACARLTQAAALPYSSA
jgi:hypothetical protein